MSLVNEQSYERRKKRRLEKLWRRSLAWLLAVCICLGNVNMAAFAVEVDGTGMFGATPSNAAKENTATPANADRGEVWLPDDTMTGEELLKEAERAITNDYRFDFDNLVKLMDMGDSAEADEEAGEISSADRYEKIFKGYESFTLFYDNGRNGRIGSENEKAYAYIVIRVPNETYQSYLNGGQTVRVATASVADAAEGGYQLTGDEDIVFLYVNASEQDVSYYLNLVDIESEEVTVPNADAIWEEPEKTEKPEVSLPAEGGMNPAGTGTADPNGAPEADKNKTELDPAAPAPDRNEAAEDSGETEGTEGSGNAQETGTAQESNHTKPDDNVSTEQETEKSQENVSDESRVPESSKASESKDAESKEEPSKDVQTDGNKGNTEETASNGNEVTNENTETSGNEAAVDNSEPEGSDSISIDTEESDDVTDAPVESEVTLSSSRHEVYTLMETSSDEEELETIDDEMTFEEWQAMVGGDEEEDEYDDGNDAVYDAEEGVIYLNLNVLPVTVAEVKKEKPKRSLYSRLFSAAQENTEQAAVLAAVTNVDNLVPKISGAHKQIEHLGGENYKLHLDIAGEKQAVDIVLVIDLSNSMDTNNRLDSLKNTIIGKKNNRGTREGGFVKAVLDQNSNSRFSVVTYGSYGEVKSVGGNIWSSNQSSIVSTIDGLKVNGGTNYEDGLWHAKESLEQRGTTDNIPYVIFLSDGQPTYYNKSGSTIFNDYSSRYGLGGTGNSTDDDTKKETVNAAKEFYKIASDRNANIYSVGFGFGSNPSSDQLQYLRAVAYGTTDKLADTSRILTSGENLSSTFASIFNELEFKNVSIVDTLSEYVDLAGNSLTSAEARVEEHKKDGTTVEVSKDDYELSYDETSKKITLKFNSDKILSVTSVYELSFNIKLSSYAYEEYSKTGYGTMVGDEDTDYKSNITSSQNPGFYSNKEAFVSFGEKGTSRIIYPKPVVQVPYEPEHRKYIKDNKDGTYDLTLDVTSKVSGTSAETVISPVDVLFVLDRTGSMAFDINGYEKGDYWFNSDKVRKDLVNRAVQTMISGSSNESGLDEYVDFRYNGIKFSGNYNSTSQVFRKDEWAKEYKTEIALADVSGGTYPNTAVTAAITLALQGSKENRNKKDVKKHIILLTDGEPSSPTSEKKGIENAISNLNNLSTPITFHVISFASKTSDYLDKLTEALNKKSNVTAIQYNALTDLDEVFSAIKTSIESSIGVDTTGVKNVVITDTLSEYADFAKADMTSDDIELLWNGTPMTEEQKAKAIKSVAVDGETKAVTVTFNEGYELEKGVTYSIRFKIKPTEEAYRKYGADGDYPDIGDEETDDPAVPENERTSSGEKGFYSNDSATLFYTSNDSPGKVPYQKPVLQVTRGRLTIIKTVTGGDEGKEFIVHVKAEDGTEYSSFSLKQYQEGDILPYIYADKKITYTITESVPMEYKNDTDNPTFRVTNHGDFVNEAKQQLEVTVGPGDDIIVEVQNVFEHKTYFHGDHLVVNRTTGDPERPFTDATEKTDNYLLAQAAAPVDPGKRGIEFRELGEDDALA